MQSHELLQLFTSLLQLVAFGDVASHDHVVLAAGQPRHAGVEMVNAIGQRQPVVEFLELTGLGHGQSALKQLGHVVGKHLSKLFAQKNRLRGIQLFFGYALVVKDETFFVHNEQQVLQDIEHRLQHGALLARGTLRSLEIGDVHARADVAGGLLMFAFQGKALDHHPPVGAFLVAQAYLGGNRRLSAAHQGQKRQLAFLIVRVHCL